MNQLSFDKGTNKRYGIGYIYIRNDRELSEEIQRTLIEDLARRNLINLSEIIVDDDNEIYVPNKYDKSVLSKKNVLKRNPRFRSSLHKLHVGDYFLTYSLSHMHRILNKCTSMINKVRAKRAYPFFTKYPQHFELSPQNKNMLQIDTLYEERIDEFDMKQMTSFYKLNKMSEQIYINGTAYGYIYMTENMLPTYEEQKIYIEKWANKYAMKLEVIVSEENKQNDDVTLINRLRLLELLTLMKEGDYFVTFKINNLATNLDIANVICDKIIKLNINIILTLFPNFVMNKENLSDITMMKTIALSENLIVKASKSIDQYYD